MTKERTIESEQTDDIGDLLLDAIRAREDYVELKKIVWTQSERIIGKYATPESKFFAGWNNDAKSPTLFPVLVRSTKEIPIDASITARLSEYYPSPNLKLSNRLEVTTGEDQLIFTVSPTSIVRHNTDVYIANAITEEVELVAHVLNAMENILNSQQQTNNV